MPMWEELTVLSLAPQHILEPTGGEIWCGSEQRAKHQAHGAGQVTRTRVEALGVLSAPATQLSPPPLAPGTEEEGDMGRHGRKELSLGLTRLLLRLPAGSRMGRSRGPGMERPGPLPRSQL